MVRRPWCKFLFLGLPASPSRADLALAAPSPLVPRVLAHLDESSRFEPTGLRLTERAGWLGLGRPSRRPERPRAPGMPTPVPAAPRLLLLSSFCLESSSSAEGPPAHVLDSLRLRSSVVLCKKATQRKGGQRFLLRRKTSWREKFLYIAAVRRRWARPVCFAWGDTMMLGQPAQATLSGDVPFVHFRSSGLGNCC